YQRYYHDFANNYRQVLSAAEGDGQLSPGDAELRAWALMGISDFIGRRYALWDKEASIEAATEAAFAFISHGIAPKSTNGRAP
ncbi:MAG: TetR/AcrR family transcriptional regulator, partial [Elstera sp.]